MLFFSCKKDDISDTGDISPDSGTRMEMTIDSIYLYARQVYLWNNVLPTYQAFDPRSKYTHLRPEIRAFQQELFDITQLAVNPQAGKPYEYPVHQNIPRYSFLEEGKGNAALQASNGMQNTANPVANHSLHKAGSKSVAYIALTSFPHLNLCKQYLDEAFDAFTSLQPSILIVDLRTNGGGHVNTVEYVANLIAPSNLSGKIMYSQRFNTTMQKGLAPILRQQTYLDADGKPVQYRGRLATMADVDYSEKANTAYFAKKGKLEHIEKIFFITSAQTASASELLINCLKPHLSVISVGEQTYGKPVGFFAINIDEYRVYYASFMLLNATGSGEYFNGIRPEIAVDLQDPIIYGSPDEAALSTILQHIIDPDRKTPNHNKPLSANTARHLNAFQLKKKDANIVPIVATQLKLKSP